MDDKTDRVRYRFSPGVNTFTRTLVGLKSGISIHGFNGLQFYSKLSPLVAQGNCMIM